MNRDLQVIELQIELQEKGKEIERLNNDFATLKLLQHKHLEEIERLNKRLDAIKDYLKQIREENKKGILSSYNLIEDNIIRLCDGLDLVKESDNND